MYYPENKIIKNLYTNGDILCYKNNGKVYIGFYHKLFNGKIFSGKDPKDQPVEELELFVNNQINSDDSEVNFSEDNLIYNYLKEVNISKKLLVPKYYHPLPKDEDYQRGEFIRYFVKKINEFYILEINKDDYTAIKNKDKQWLYYIYEPFELKWKIIGEYDFVVHSNIIQIEEIERKYKFVLKNYFKNKFDKYYRTS